MTLLKLALDADEAGNMAIKEGNLIVVKGVVAQVRM